MTMFTSITVWRAFLSFRLSFRHNLAERAGTETLIVRITTSSGKTGYGQVLPRSYLTGETLDGAQQDIRERWWPQLRGARWTDGAEETILSKLFNQADAEKRNAGYAGVDVAAGMAAGLPVLNNTTSSGMDGAGRKRLDLVGVIPASGARKAALLARIYKLLGYRRFKVKVGTDRDADAARLAAVRRTVGNNAWLTVDANAAWDWDEAIARMRGLGGEFGVSLVEEPLRHDVAPDADIPELERLGGVSTMADESLCHIEDANRLLERGGPSWWNIRLAKNGGFSGVNRLAKLAREHGIRLYGGILVGETGAMAAAGRYSFFETGVECGEYGFSRVFVKGDPFRGAPAGYGGYYIAPEPGSEKLIEASESAIPGKIVFADSLEVDF